MIKERSRKMRIAKFKVTSKKEKTEERSTTSKETCEFE